jgi:CHAT domain-containing protein
MAGPVQIMVLPAGVKDVLPQVFFEDAGMWREAVRSIATDPEPELRKTVETFLSPIMKQIGEGAVPKVPPSGPGFRAKFKQIYRDVLPVEVRDLLQKTLAASGATRPQLTIFFRGAAEWIPWELLHDGQNYLGVQFSISRLPIIPHATSVQPPRHCIVSRVYNLLANHVLDGTALMSWESTFSRFAKSAAWEARFPSNGTGDFPTVSQLDEAVDAGILHVTCHGGLREDEKSEYYWTLDHQSPTPIDFRITATIAKDRELSARPLVFANACSSVEQATDLIALQGFGPSFLIAGALNFIGTFAPITKTMAVEFARRFYTNLFRETTGEPRVPVAEALRATKQSFADENCTDPSYLFYCLYGPGDSTFQPA